MKFDERENGDRARVFWTVPAARFSAFALVCLITGLLVLSFRTSSFFDNSVKVRAETAEDRSDADRSAIDSPNLADSVVSYTSKRSALIPNVTLITHEGRSIHLRDDLIKGKKVCINFMYTICNGICPGMTRNIKKVRDELASLGVDDVVFISISIEPDQDTPERLQTYLEINEIENKPGLSPWIFLTGELSDIEQVRRSLGVYDPDPGIDADRRQHGGTLTYGNDLTNWWGATPALQNTELLVQTLLRNVVDNRRTGPKLTRLNRP